MPGTSPASCDVVLDLCGRCVTSGTSGAMSYCERAVGEFRNSQTISAWACIFVASMRVVYCRTLGGPRDFSQRDRGKVSVCKVIHPMINVNSSEGNHEAWLSMTGVRLMVMR